MAACSSCLLLGSTTRCKTAPIALRRSILTSLGEFKKLLLNQAITSRGHRKMASFFIEFISSRWREAVDLTRNRKWQNV
jgi:hypothetical protein